MRVNLEQVRMSHLEICQLFEKKLCDAFRKKAIVGLENSPTSSGKILRMNLEPMRQ